ncbi:MAG: hypothetical protein HQL52_17970 [Magnetococcales bacterium]|nr:hypothetical protein [Magnetococcales bacterium]
MDKTYAWGSEKWSEKGLLLYMKIALAHIISTIFIVFIYDHSSHPTYWQTFIDYFHPISDIWSASYIEYSHMMPTLAPVSLFFSTCSLIVCLIYSKTWYDIAVTKPINKDIDKRNLDLGTSVFGFLVITYSVLIFAVTPPAYDKSNFGLRIFNSPIGMVLSQAVIQIMIYLNVLAFHKISDMAHKKTGKQSCRPT